MAGKGKPEQGNGGGGPALGSTSCLAEDCRGNNDRFGFCRQHYEHFKFGLVKRNGKKVPDYDKKFEHYKALKERQGQKVA